MVNNKKPQISRIAQIKQVTEGTEGTEDRKNKTGRGIGGFGAKNLRLNPPYLCGFSAFFACAVLSMRMG